MAGYHRILAHVLLATLNIQQCRATKTHQYPCTSDQ